MNKMSEEYKTLCEQVLENLEEARITDNDYLLENAEIEALFNYIDFLEKHCKESRH